MALQARAEATRRKILDSAVDLFSELGYGETGLADILARAGVSKGAFYYHFDSKEAVATAIIEEFAEKLYTSARARFDPSAPDLSGVINATCESAWIIASDKAARVGHELLQALSQISGVATQTYVRWTEEFVEIIALAVQPLADDRGVDATEVAKAVWVGVLGSHLLSSALGDDRMTWLRYTWRLALELLAPPGESDAYVGMVDDIVASYTASV